MTLPLTERPRPPLLGGEEDADGGGEHDRLRDLNGKGGADRPPPQLRETLALREQMAEQQQRRGADEHDDDRRPEQVDDDERDGRDRAAEPEQGEEDAAAGERADDQGLERCAGRGRAGAVAEEGGGERVAERDHLAAEAEARVDHDRGEREPAQQLLERVAALHRLVAHRQPGGEQQQEQQQRVGRDEADLPQPGDLSVVREWRRRQHGLADQVEHRRERVDGEPLEPVVDRLPDPPRQVPEVRVTRLTAVDARRCAAADGRAARDRPNLQAGQTGRHGHGRLRVGRLVPARVGGRDGRQRKCGRCREDEDAGAAHPPTIFWMIVIAAGANSAKAKPRPALAIALFAFSTRTGSPPAIT